MGAKVHKSAIERQGFPPPFGNAVGGLRKMRAGLGTSERADRPEASPARRTKTHKSQGAEIVNRAGLA
jgi:hypothetical protein